MDKQTLCNIRSDLAVVVATYNLQLDDLALCLADLKRGAGYVVVCYSGKHKEDIKTLVDAANVDKLIMIGNYGKWPGDIQSTQKGLESAYERGCTYTLKINGDVFLGLPENIPLLVDELDGYDFIAPQWYTHKDCSSTMMFFGKTDKLCKAWESVPAMGENQVERRWCVAYSSNGLRYKLIPYAIQPMDLEDPEKNGFWGKLLGFRHIHGVRRRMHKRINKGMVR